MVFYTGTSRELEILNNKVLEMELQDSVARARSEKKIDRNPVYKINTHVNFMDNDIVLKHVEFENKDEYDDMVQVNYKNVDIFTVSKSKLMNNLGIVVEERAENSLEEKYKEMIVEAANILRPDYNHIVVIDRTYGYCEAIKGAALLAVQQKNKL